jgi:hypothetical protein
MQAFVKKLQGQLEKELDSVDPGQNAIKGYDHRIRIINKYINGLKEYICEHPFSDLSVEIHYFKHIAPAFYSQHLYFIKLYNLELCRISSCAAEFIKHAEHELQEIEVFFKENNAFCKYFHSGNSFLDEKYFTRSAREHWMDDLSTVIDEDFCVASYRASWMLANDRYRKYLTQQLSSPDPLQNAGTANTKWTGTVSEAVELLVALQASGLIEIDNQPATLIQLKERFRLFAELDIRDISDTDHTNRQKKKQSTPFLARLTAKYIDRMNHLLGSS